jgi:hypothetical protein
MSIFARLNFDAEASGNSVQALANNTIKHMQSLPPLMTAWQQGDVANSATTGYYKNPVANATTNITNSANSIIAITGLEYSSANIVFTAASSLLASGNEYRAHTDRLSGVTPVNANTISLPHFKTVMSTGKTMMYIVFQSDGVQNNAPIVGGLTSLYKNDDLVTFYTKIQGYSTQISNSMNSTTVDDGINPPVTTYESNLSSTILNSMVANLSSITTFMNTRRTADVAFFNTSQEIVANYNDVKGFSNMGQTETELMNLVGTDKLLERLNS